MRALEHRRDVVETVTHLTRIGATRTPCTRAYVNRDALKEAAERDQSGDRSGCAVRCTAFRSPSKTTS
jgi:hypothetical protein